MCPALPAPGVAPEPVAGRSARAGSAAAASHGDEAGAKPSPGVKKKWVNLWLIYG